MLVVLVVVMAVWFVSFWMLLSSPPWIFWPVQLLLPVVGIGGVYLWEYARSCSPRKEL